MQEGNPLPNFSNKIEAEGPPNSYYQAITENQRMWREAERGVVKPHERRRVSETIETNFKSVFAPYIDPGYPRILISLSLLADAPKGTVPYFFYENRMPENIQEEDQEGYAGGIYSLNEWATNYAARYYMEHVSKHPVTTALRKLYGQAGDAIIGRTFAIPAYKAMDEVKKTAKATGADLDEAVFQGLFQHEFTALNALIADTNTVEASSVDELAIAIGKRTSHTINAPRTIFTHLLEKPSDPSIVKTLKRTGLSLALGGAHAKPGISEIWLAGPAAVSLASALGDFVFSGNIREALSEGGLVVSTSFLTLHFLSIHETIHAYSGSSDRIGLMPVQVQKENEG